MKSNLLNYILTKSLTFKNLLYCLINSFLIMIVLVCLTILTLSFEAYNDIINSVTARTLLVPSDTDIELLKSNEHIIFADIDKYRFGYNFDYGNGSYIYIKPLVTDNYLKITEGTKLANKGDMICPKEFYPYEYEFDYTKFKKQVNGRKFLGQTISDGENLYKIVGTYKNIKTEEANNCYISKEDFDSLDVDSYDYIMIIYDNSKNLKNVETFLTNNNISYMEQYTFDTSFSLYFTIPLYIILIILIILLNISYNFLRKYIRNNNRNIGLLRVYGEKKENILNYYVNTSLVLLTISILLSLIWYTITFIITKPYLAEFNYYSIYIKYPLISASIFFFLYYIFTILLVKHFLKERMKVEVYTLLESENNA